MLIIRSQIFFAKLNFCEYDQKKLNKKFTLFLKYFNLLLYFEYFVSFCILNIRNLLIKIEEIKQFWIFHYSLKIIIIL